MIFVTRLLMIAAVQAQLWSAKHSTVNDRDEYNHGVDLFGTFTDPYEEDALRNLGVGEFSAQTHGERRMWARRSRLGAGASAVVPAPTLIDASQALEWDLRPALLGLFSGKPIPLRRLARAGYTASRAASGRIADVS
jgi:hypothetical protein